MRKDTEYFTFSGLFRGDFSHFSGLFQGKFHIFPKIALNFCLEQCFPNRIAIPESSGYDRQSALRGLLIERWQVMAGLLHHFDYPVKAH